MFMKTSECVCLARTVVPKNKMLYESGVYVIP